MHASEFITIAGRIVAYGPAGARSAISRAYYGAFHLAQAQLSDLGCRVPASGASHAIVPAFLMASRHPDAKAAGRILSDLHHDRLSADYRLERTYVEVIEFAMEAVESAHRVQIHLNTFQTDCQTDPTIRTDLLAAVEAIKRARQLR